VLVVILFGKKLRKYNFITATSEEGVQIVKNNMAEKVSTG